MPDIFLSYTREDQATAQHFAEAFQAQGFTVWWDVTLRSGEAYDQVTEEALRTAKAVVVLWSKKSVVSRWVRAEATLADRNRTLVPAMIEPCERPIMFELTQSADLSRWTGEAADPAWRAFLADVRGFVEAVAPARPPARPLAEAAAPPMHSTPALSIAVLPFINRSDRPEDEFFADGMVEDLTAALSIHPALKVVAPSATTIYRKDARDLRQIGRDLGVRYLLEGSVRRVGADLRVSARLVDAEIGNILWTQKFERPLAELSSLQDDLVEEVAAHLKVQMRRLDMADALNAPGETTARGMAVRSMAHGQLATRAGLAAAVAEARRAVEIDPNYGLGYALLAALQGRLWNYRRADDPQLAREVLDNIRHARALDPNNRLDLSAIAWGLAGVGKLQDALALAQHSASMSPYFETAHLAIGTVLVRLGQPDAALAELDAVERLAPNDSWFVYFSGFIRSVAHLQAGRLEQALEAVDRALRLLPGTDALIQRMLCLASLGRWGWARDALGQLRDADREILCTQVENFVRDFYCGSNAVDEYVAIVGKLWEQTAGEPSAP
jgi:TolB-like protein